jgi:hypothetical protein
VIAFGCAITSGEAYRRYAEPGVKRSLESDSAVLAFAAVQPIPRTYNLILDAARAHDDLEALVIVHPHTEIVDPGFCEKVREALRDPDVGVVGCTGANRVRSIAWWEGDVVSAPVIHRYQEHGGGEMPAYSWTPRMAPPAEVETLDDQLLILSPWAVHNLRFDESLILNFGFGLDFCLRVREAGRKAWVSDLRVVHHRSLELVENLDLWIEGHIRLAEHWDTTLHGGAADEDVWRLRAREAEARREAARAIAFSAQLNLDARVEELERELDAKLESFSWRVTAPLRELNRIRRERAGRGAGLGSGAQERPAWDRPRLQPRAPRRSRAG